MTNPLLPYSIVLITLGFAVVLGVNVGLAADGPGEVGEAYNGTDRAIENSTDSLEGNVSGTTISVVTTATEAMVNASRSIAYGVAWYFEAVKTDAGKAVFAASVGPSAAWIVWELY